VVRVCGARITGPLTIRGSSGPVAVGGEGCDPNTIIGPVRMTDNTGGVEVVGNTIAGPVVIQPFAACPVEVVGPTLAP